MNTPKQTDEQLAWKVAYKIICTAQAKDTDFEATKATVKILLHDLNLEQLIAAQQERDELKFPTGQTKVGTMAVIVNDKGQIWLGQKGRAVSPEFVGKWVCPGGRVKYNESLEAATLRECLEETGFIVEIQTTLPVQQILDERFHFVFPTFLCKVSGGKEKAGDDLSNGRWFCPSELTNLPMTPITKLAIQSFVEREQLIADKYRLIQAYIQRSHVLVQAQYMLHLWTAKLSRFESWKANGLTDEEIGKSFLNDFKQLSKLNDDVTDKILGELNGTSLDSAIAAQQEKGK